MVLLTQTGMDFLDDLDFIDNHWFVVAWKNNMHGEQQGEKCLRRWDAQLLCFHNSRPSVPVCHRYLAITR